jgi:hypothetical protein
MTFHKTEAIMASGSRQALTALMALGIIAIGSANTEAAASVKIVRINFDAPGTDKKTSNASLNAESVTVKNATTKPIALKGWKLSDAQAHVYAFPATYQLGAGKSVRVHSGTGVNTATDLYWRVGNFVWNNDTDTATLKNAAAAKVSTCHYPNKAGGVTIAGTSASGKYANCP